MYYDGHGYYYDYDTIRYDMIYIMTKILLSFGMFFYFFIFFIFFVPFRP